jgi:magnesium transporter
LASKVIAEAGVFEAADLLASMHAKAVASLISRMPADDMVTILEDLPETEAEQLLALMEPTAADKARRMLAYPSSSAGRLMSTRAVRVQLSWNVDDTIQYLRTVDPETDTFAHLYAVNARGVLVGLIRLRHLLVAQPQTLLADLVEPNTIAVRVDTDQEDAARLMSKYDFSALPVTDAAGKLVGVITHDDVLDVLEEEATEDIHRLGGSSPLDEPYLQASTVTLYRKRIVWLLLLLLTSTLTLSVMSSFEHTLVQFTVLAWFIPLLIGTGGNAGSQTTAMVIRALAVGDVDLTDSIAVWWQELLTGVLLGLSMGFLSCSVALIWGAGFQVAIVVACSACVVVIWSTSVGALLPLVASKLRLDPTVISGPMMSTLVDATGLLIYLSIARSLLAR